MFGRNANYHIGDVSQLPANDINHDNVSLISRFSGFYRSPDSLRAANRGLDNEIDRWARSSRSSEFIEATNLSCFQLCVLCALFLFLSCRLLDALDSRHEAQRPFLFIFLCHPSLSFHVETLSGRHLYLITCREVSHSLSAHWIRDKVAQ